MSDGKFRPEKSELFSTYRASPGRSKCGSRTIPEAVSYPMNVYEAMQERRSIRQFLDKPIPREVLTRALENALRAPSWKNCQPFSLHIAEGDVKKRISERMKEAVAKRERENPDEPYQKEWPTEIKKRMFDLGMKLYEHLGIGRGEKQKRMDMMLANFDMFGAPTGLFFFADERMRFWPEFDVGILYGYIMLALMEEGLGSCPQASLAAYPQIVKEELQIPEGMKLLVGMSVGYPDPDALTNSFRSEREPFDSMVKFHGQ